MNSFEKMIQICKDFQLGKFSVDEFQKRLETVLLPDECKNTLEIVQHNSCNKLEEILYSYAESQKQFAEKVAEDLMQATILEYNRLKTVKT